MGEEIRFVETYALAEDRSKALENLVPGTEDHFYYTCLTQQHAGDLKAADETLTRWRSRYGHTARVVEMDNRQALLKFAKTPKVAWEFLPGRMGLGFDHERDQLDAETDLPTQLKNEGMIDRETLSERAFRDYSNSLQGFENSALDWLAASKLTPDRRRDLLRRLTRPDVPNLAQMIHEDLAHVHAEGFGSYPIHQNLLLTQLDELLLLRPALLNDSRFVNIYLTRLQPGPESEITFDLVQRGKHIERLWSFVSRLAPAHNSLKAQVLFHWLMNDRAQGRFDRERFLRYVQTPRRVGYLCKAFREADETRRFSADLGAVFDGTAGLSAVGNDELLVQSYLEHFFSTETDYQAWVAWIDSEWLKKLFAETKLLSGHADPEKWTALLAPAAYQALKDRIDLVFQPTNRSIFRKEEVVSIDIAVKNVKTLIVKVFELNLVNFYRENGSEVDTAFNLDGLVANDEQVVELDEAPLHRTVRHFDFPALNRRGVYLIEFIGGGQSCRALIRKGLLRHVVQVTPAGHEFRILDEMHAPVADAGLWLDGRYFAAEGLEEAEGANGPDGGAAKAGKGKKSGGKKSANAKPGTEADAGVILVPFSHQPGVRQVVLTQAGGGGGGAAVDHSFAALATFDHQAESYELFAGFHIEREALMPRRKATLLVRPSLMLADSPVSLELLEEIQLVVSTTDLDGVTALKTVHDFKVFEDHESSFEFQVPERLSTVRFTLQAKVKNLSTGKKDDLSASAEFPLNGIDTQAYVEDLHLSQFAGEFALELLGKTGEERPRRPIPLEVKHRDFRQTVDLTLQTDEAGRIGLGKLVDIEWVKASGPEGISRQWALPKDLHSLPSAIHGREGDVLFVASMSGATGAAAERAEFSLLELRGTAFLADRFDALSVKNGLLEIRGLTPGNYSLFLKRNGVTIDLRIAAGVVVANNLLSQTRQLEQLNLKPLQIAAVGVAKETVSIQLTHATAFARVHLAATRFMPSYPLYQDLNSIPNPGLTVGKLAVPASSYISTRALGDEYTYVIERKYATKRPGNMLARPSALLNPWSIRKTSTSHQEVMAGEDVEAASDFQAAERAPKPRPSTAHTRVGGGGGDGGETPNLDFLGEPAVFLSNLVPDKNGVVTVKRKDLGAHQHLHIVAVDPENTAFRTVSLVEQPTPVNDLRLTHSLDPAQEFAEQKEVHLQRSGGAFVVEDLRTSEFELYDALPKLYTLFATLLNNNSTFAEFGFVARWPKLSAEEKSANYAKYACHELNFFLLHKDPAFFKAVVKPYIAHKKDQTFLDLWLLDADLSEFLKPWAYQRLNTLERILLSRRFKDDGPRTSRHIGDLAALLPIDVDGFNQRFDTALKTSALETESPLGADVGAATDKAFRQAAPTGRLMGDAGFGGGGSFGAGAMANMAPAASLSMQGPMAPPAPPAKAARAEMAKDSMDDMAELDEGGASEERSEREHSNRSRSAPGGGGRGGNYRDAKKRMRAEARQLYRELDQTEEWAENNYYRILIEAQNAALIPVSAFWRDYAAWDGKTPFLSTHAAEAARSHTEALLALAVLDLPFDAPVHTTKIEEARLRVGLTGDAVLFHKEIKRAEPAGERTPVLVSQNFYRLSDRYEEVDNEQVDKYVTGEFLTHVVYGLHVVATNPSSARQRLEVLLEIPQGALPVMSARRTHSRPVAIEPFSTETFEVHFYFPAPGRYSHYPVHIARNGKVLTSAPAVKLTVVREPSTRDTESWDYVSQFADEETVLAFLEKRNLFRVELSRIAFRMRDKVFFQKALALLDSRHVYDHTLFSYGLHHKDVAIAREYLLHEDSFVSTCGAWIDTALLRIDPVARRAYQHLEYSPLVNARAHTLGKRRQIQNDRLAQQYHALMNILAYRPQLDAADCLSVTYYLLLQDRVDEAERFFAMIDPKKLESRLQYDYFAVYLDFFRAGQGKARATVKKYAQYPVDRWRHIFAQAAAQLAELDSASAAPAVAAPADPDNRDAAQGALAATEASFDLKIEGAKLILHYQNLTDVRVNYYRMDIEMLFSRNPFVDTGTGQFAMIRPNFSQVLELPANGRSHTVKLPDQFAGQNVMIEVVAGSVRRSQACFAHALAVQVIEAYGQVRVTHQKTGVPIEAAYTKVYARMGNGGVQFYKDGYTDPRGRFDFTSISTDELKDVERFAVLILSEKFGAVVKEAAPPKT